MRSQTITPIRKGDAAWLVLVRDVSDSVRVDTDLTQRRAIANLHPKDWFLPFRDAAD